MSKLNFYDTTFMLCNITDDIYMNNDYINVINSKDERYRAENSQQTENT